VILFISVTTGIEKTWVKKLTSLHAPIRLTPTEAYFNSYYNQVDCVSMASDYTAKNLQEKRWAIVTDPYDEDVDASVPSNWPAPVRNDDGSLKDLVKEAFCAIEEANDGALVADCFEVSGALLRLKLLRPAILHGGMENQNFLTQMTYVSSFTDEEYVRRLLSPPLGEDINHLLYLNSRSDHTPLVDGYAPTKEMNTQITIPHGIEVTEVRPKGTFFKPSFAMFNEGARFQAHIKRSQVGISYIELTENGDRTVEKRGDAWVIDSGEKVNGSVPVITSPYLNLKAENATYGAEFVGKMMGQTIRGYLPWDQLEVLKVQGEPFALEDDSATPVYLPKNFRDSGVFIGDSGYLAYGGATSGGAAEQRLLITVRGFYDPGVLSVGARCILMPKEAVRDIVLANHSFALDPEMTSGVQVWYNDLDKTDAIAAKIQEGLKERGLEKYFRLTTFREYSFAKDLLQQFQSDKTLFTLVGVIILIVACSNIISFLVLLVNDKKREIGILMAMGASRRSIGMIFASCGVVVGSLGGVLGTVAALLTLRNIDKLIWLLSKIQGHDLFNAVFYGSSLQTEVSHTALVFVLVTTPLMSLLAGMIPAMKAARLKPTALLRAE
jgi:lipoprotein-releasing system permease protein